MAWDALAQGHPVSMGLFRHLPCAATSTKPAGNVIFRLFIFWFDENRVGVIEFDQLA
jgi:hypothetical protein